MAEYVYPAIASWKGERDAKHLAIHAIAQIDIMAEVVLNHLKANGVEPADTRAGPFREKLRMREPMLGYASDAHDSHKHGRLNAQTRPISQGQRPETVKKAKLFPETMHRKPPYVIITSTIIVLNDGTELPVERMVVEGVEAWERELIRLNL